MTTQTEDIRLRKEFVGEVISDKMTKTIVVQTERRVRHDKYNKVITRKAKFYAHDEKEVAGMGDVVRIRETRPLSKLKRWSLVEIVRKGPELLEPVVRSLSPKKKQEAVQAGGEA